MLLKPRKAPVVAVAKIKVAKKVNVAEHCKDVSTAVEIVNRLKQSIKGLAGVGDAQTATSL